VIAGVISPPCGRFFTGSLTITCGDAQQRPSDASQIPLLSAPFSVACPFCALPDHRDISEACPAPRHVPDAWPPRELRGLTGFAKRCRYTARQLVQECRGFSGS
jgi:hypothetical protein